MTPCCCWPAARVGVAAQGDAVPAFEAALQRVCDALAYKIVDDGEGVTHVVTLEISGAANNEDAMAIARTIATSPLCKTAWSSADPNWGRLLAAAGRAGVAFDPAQVQIAIGGLPVFEFGVRAESFRRSRDPCSHEPAGVYDRDSDGPRAGPSALYYLRPDPRVRQH